MFPTVTILGHTHLVIDFTAHAGCPAPAPTPHPQPLSTLLSLALRPGSLATVDQIHEFVALELLIMSTNRTQEKPMGWAPPWEVTLGYLCPLTKGHLSGGLLCTTLTTC